MNKVLLAASAILILSQPFTNSASKAAELATQGQFAVSLAERLGYKESSNEQKAIKLFSDLSINPGIGPHSKWEKDSPATTKFVAEIQASVQIMLKEVAQGLNIPPPPTLDLYVFELPPAPQRAFFPTDTPQLATSGQALTVASGDQPPGSPPPFAAPPPPPSGSLNDAPPAIQRMPPPPPGMEAVPPPPGSEAQYPTLGTVTDPETVPMIDDRVISALAMQREVPVIIELKPPVQEAGPSQPNEQLVAASQQAVLDNLSSGDFRLKHRYETVFSMAGWLTKNGLTKLQNDPNVLRINLDSVAAPH